MPETWVLSLGWEDPLEKGTATSSSILVWKIPWTEEPGKLQSMESQRAGQDWAADTFTTCWVSFTEGCCWFLRLFHVVLEHIFVFWEIVFFFFHFNPNSLKQFSTDEAAICFSPSTCQNGKEIVFHSERKVKMKLLSRVSLFETPWTVCSLPGSTIHGIFQARILEWVAISFSRRSSQPRDWAQVSHIAGRRFTVWATREVFHRGVFILLRSLVNGDLVRCWGQGQNCGYKIHGKISLTLY